MHSQAILRVVDPAEGTVTEDDFIEAEANEASYVAGVASGSISSISDDHARSVEAEPTVDPDTEPGHQAQGLTARPSGLPES